MQFVFEIFKETIAITVFVIVMMMIIEFINIKTKGIWTEFLRKSVWLQILFSALLGVIPGCLGAFIVVSLYIHRLIGIGALIAALIATFGDEAYILFGLSSSSALQLMGIIYLIAVLFGFTVNLFTKKKYIIREREPNFVIHSFETDCVKAKGGILINNFRKVSFNRALLLFGILIYFFVLITGYIGNHHQESIHNHGSNFFRSWLNYTFLFIAFIALILVIIVSDHFLEEHLWGHVIKHHFLKIFLWTFGAILIIHILLDFLNLENWISDNQLLILMLALLIGIIPESGPHLLFITLFISGSIPFSILLANSIVQDGHATLPLFAESKNSFLIVKGIKLVIGFLIGLSGVLMNW